MLQIYSGGFPLETLGNVTDISVTSTRDNNNGNGNGGGSRCATVTFKIESLAPDFTHPNLMRGNLVEVFDEGVPLGASIMTEPDRSSWTFTTSSIALEMANQTCHKLVMGDLVPCTVLDDVVDYAISQGLPVKRPLSLRDTPFVTINNGSSIAVDDTIGSETLRQGIRTLADLLDRVAAEAGKRWWIDEYQMIRMDADPVIGEVEPDWGMLPETAQMGTADPDYYTTLVGLYALTWGPSPEFAVLTTKVEKVEDEDAIDAGYPHRARYIDFTGLRTTPGWDSATNYSTGDMVIAGTAFWVATNDNDDEEPEDGSSYWEKVSSLDDRLKATGVRVGFTNRLELTAQTVDNLGGTPMYHYDILPGDVLRLRTIDDSSGNVDFGAWVDIIVNEVVKTDTNESVVIAPMNLVTRTLSDFVSDMTSNSSAA